MPLSAGERLGPYEILAPIGAGGMGEVYRARDTKLKREVALKVLPDAFARDPERMARFQREAEVLASLNHPNIATIHGVEDGALVMELVEGNSPKGPLPFDEAWKIASQIAAALEYAHERGIMHRDLKPANIMITPDGVVKLLDFGLAKAFSNQREPSASPENSPTLTLGATEIGVILGTAAYMAPEQARGKTVDKRADVWSFGVVLYELLTGERLFTGEDAAETLAAVIHKPPDLTKVPRQARRLLEECLQKDPKQRLRDIGDAKRLLGGESPAQPPPAPRHRSWLPWCMAAFLLLALMPANILHLREQPTVERTLRYTIPPPEKSVLQSLAVSPDGRYVVISADKNGRRQLWLRAMAADELKVMPDTEGASAPFWSPDSRFIAFAAQGKLKKIAASGGPAEAICDVTAISGGSWSKDDVILFATTFSGAQGIWRVPASGGVPVDVLKGLHRFPVFLPDGHHFLYLDRGGASSKDGIYIASLDGSGIRRILSNASSIAVAPPSGSDTSSHLLFLRESTLMTQSFDTGRVQLLGDAVPIAQNVSMINFTYMPVTVSANGLLIYYTGGDSNQLAQIAWFDRTGKPGGIVTPLGQSANPALSPDERTVAFQRVKPNGADIWLHDLARGLDTRLTVAPLLSSSPFWSNKGDRVAFHSNRDGSSSKLYQRAVNGSGQDEMLASAGENMGMNQWSKDGQFIIYTQRSGKGDFDIGVLPMREGAPADRKPALFLQTPFDEYHGQLSPDSHWMAYTSDESGEREVYVVSFPAGSGKTHISTAGGEQPRWRGDGKELFYVAADGKMMSVPVRAVSGTAPSLEADAPVPLFETSIYRIITAPTLYQYDVTADGKRFLIATAADASTPPLNVVTNWQATLKK